MNIYIVVCLTVTTIVLQVQAKGAKVRPSGKRPASNRDKVRVPGNTPGSVQPSPEEKLNYLTAYEFRNASHEERLLAYLFRDYDPVARAVMDTSQPVVVNISFVLLRIHGLEERSQVLTTTGLVIAEWTDDRLTWEPRKFGNVTDIILKADKIWLPELAVMNGAEELVPDFERIRVLLNYDGRLHWEPGGIFRTTCDIDITYFPFDTQHCPILIGAYSYYSNKMNITNATSEMSTHEFQQNGEWYIRSTSAHWNITILNCCLGDGYAHVIFTLHLMRRYKFYMMNIVLPCLMLSTLIMIGFFLPPEAGEKISLGISVLLAFTVFLLMIADNIPRTSLAIPLIVVYLMTTMILGTISICMTVLVLNVHYREPKEQPKRWLRKLILIHLARLLCMRTTYQKVHQAEMIWKRRPGYVPPTQRQPYHINGLFFDLASVRFACRDGGGGPTKPSSNGTRRQKILKEFDGLHFTSRTAPYPGAADLDEKSSSSSSAQGAKDYSEEWRDLVRVLDRLFFWVICILMSTSTICILLYPKYTGVEGS